MSLLRRKNIQKSLAQKGFRPDEKEIWYFWYKEQRTGIKIRVSLGQKYREYSDPMLKSKIMPLKLQSLKELKDLFICPMDKEGYIEKLQSRGIQL